MVHVFRHWWLDQGVHFRAQDCSFRSDIVERRNRHLLIVDLAQHLLVIAEGFVNPGHESLVFRASWGLVCGLRALDLVEGWVYNRGT